MEKSAEFDRFVRLGDERLAGSLPEDADTVDSRLAGCVRVNPQEFFTSKLGKSF